MRLLKVLGLSLVAGLMLAAPAFAGVTADLTFKQYNTTKDGKQKERLATGKYFSQDKKVMVEHLAKIDAAEKNKKTKDGKPVQVREPNKQGFIIDQTSWQAKKLVPVKKKYVEINLAEPRKFEQGFWYQFVRQGGVPANTEEFKKRGLDLKLVKEEKMGGHPCKLWSATRTLQTSKEEIQIWEAKDLDNLPVKVLVKEDGKKKSEFVLSNIKKAQVDVAQFSPPADYQKHEIKIMTGSMPEGLKKQMNGPGAGTQAKTTRKL